MKKTAAESQRMLIEAYGDYGFSESNYRHAPKKFEDKCFWTNMMLTITTQQKLKDNNKIE